MSTVIEEFIAELGWEIDTKGLKQFNRQISGVKSDLKALAKYGTIAAGALAYGFNKVMKSFSLVEDSVAAFQPMMGGSLEKATELVDRLNDLAAETPFKFETLSKAAKQLLPNMGGDIEKTINTIRMLGDTAGGNAQQLDSITRGMNKTLIKGKADLEALNMIADSGVPIFDELAKSMNVKKGPKLFKMISAGKVDIDDLTLAFKSMTSTGGTFFRGMEIASATFTGRVSTLIDNAVLAAAAFGDALSPAVKEVVEDMLGGARGLREWVKANKELIRSEGGKWIRGFADSVKTAFTYLRKLNTFVQSIGGWETTIKRIGFAFASWEIGRLVTGVAGLVSGLKAVGGLNLASMFAASGIKSLVTGGLLAAIPLLIQDIYTSLKGGKGAFQEEADAIAEYAMRATEWFAEILGLDPEQFKLGMVWALDDVGKALEQAGEKIKEYLDTIVNGFSTAITKITEYWGKIKSLFSDASSFLMGVGGDVMINAIAGQVKAMAPSTSTVSTVNNDNRSYRVAPSASITQTSGDFRQAQREMTRTMERQINGALRSIG